MGAMEYMVMSKGKDMDTAFWAAVEQALHDHGHSGYTGTIAEKYEYIRIEDCPQRLLFDCDSWQVAAEAWVSQHMDDENHFSNDKWGPSAAFHVKDDIYCFFGWASS